MSRSSGTTCFILVVCEQPYQIADQVKDRVLIDRLGPVALAVAAHVRGNDVEARLSQRVDLAAPGVRDFREAVAEQNKRALTLFDDIRRDQWIGGSSLGRGAT